MNKIVFWLLATSLLLFIASIFVPVWSMSIENRITIGPFSGSTLYENVNAFSDSSKGTGDLAGYSNTDYIIDMTGDFQVILLVFFVMTISSIIIIGWTLLKMDDESWTTSGNDLLPSAAMTLATPWIFIIFWPMALSKNDGSYVYGLFGTHTEGISTVTYGPNIGWFLQLMAFVMIAVAIILPTLLKEKNMNEVKPNSD